jgi:glucokinase
MGLALVDVATGKIHARTDGQTPAGPGPTVGFLAQAVLELIEQAGSKPVAGVGVGCPGPLNPFTGVIYETPNMRGWSNFPLAETLANATKLPVIVDNDANAAAFGEYRYGRAADDTTQDFIFVTLGTGVGGGIILGGELWHGKTGTGGEIGHTVVTTDGPRCGCGATGCLEALAGIAGIKHAYHHAAVSSGERPEQWTRDIEAMADAARSGSLSAMSAFKQLGWALGVASASWVNLLAPEAIVFGGGIADAWDLFGGEVDRVCRERAFKPSMAGCAIRKSRVGADAGILGAAALASPALEPNIR